jgi:hypothetical protein
MRLNTLFTSARRRVVLTCAGEMIDPVDDRDLDPSSEVRSISPSARRLVVDTGLRGKAAEAAWITVTDEAGVIYFDGPPSADGCIDVSFQDAPHVSVARVQLETLTGHRQAQVPLGKGWTAHGFG